MKTHYADLETKHEEVTILIEDDEQFEVEERYIEQCQETLKNQRTRLYEATDRII